MAESAGMPLGVPLVCDLRVTSREQAARGEFERFVLAHQVYVTRLVFRLLGWQDDVEDAVQEVFLRAWNGWRGFRGQSRPTTWLTRIAINVCHAQRRRRWLRQRLLPRLWRPPQHEADAPSYREHDTREQAVRDAVRRLPPSQRDVVVLYYLEEFPVRQIAEILRVSTGAVDARLSRARKRLRGMLEEAEVV